MIAMYARVCVKCSVPATTKAIPVSARTAAAYRAASGRGRLEVAEHGHHARPGVALLDAPRCGEALVGVRRRHPDVDDRDVGPLLLDERLQPVRVARLARHLEPGVGQQSREALAEEQRVVGDRYPHGIS